MTQCDLGAMRYSGSADSLKPDTDAILGPLTTERRPSNHPERTGEDHTEEGACGHEPPVQGRGKRPRQCCRCWWGRRSVSHEGHYVLGACIEIHNFTLVHDDIMDRTQSEGVEGRVRRLHRHQRGDAMLALSFEMLADSTHRRRAAQATRPEHRGDGPPRLRGAAGGLRVRGGHVSEEDYVNDRGQDQRHVRDVR